MGKDGSVMGVTHTRSSVLCHSRTLTVACNYTEGEVMVCVLDFKREVGLWHGILAVSTSAILLPLCILNLKKKTKQNKQAKKKKKNREKERIKQKQN